MFLYNHPRYFFVYCGAIVNRSAAVVFLAHTDTDIPFIFHMDNTHGNVGYSELPIYDQCPALFRKIDAMRSTI